MWTGLAEVAENDKNKLILELSGGRALWGKESPSQSPPRHPSLGRRGINALQTPGPQIPLRASPHPASLGRGCLGLGLLVFLARPLAVQCSRVKIAGVEGTALTSLLSAHPPPLDQAPPGLGATVFHCFTLAPSHLLRPLSGQGGMFWSGMSWSLGGHRG